MINDFWFIYLHIYIYLRYYIYRYAYLFYNYYLPTLRIFISKYPIYYYLCVNPRLNETPSIWTFTTTFKRLYRSLLHNLFTFSLCFYDISTPFLPQYHEKTFLRIHVLLCIASEKKHGEWVKPFPSLFHFPSRFSVLPSPESGLPTPSLQLSSPSEEEADFHYLRHGC